jgi:hypothetical protein
VKKFLSTQDIEDLAAQGRAELIVDDDTVLTDLARHAAQQLGIALVSRSRSAPPAATPPPAPPLTGEGRATAAAPRREAVGLGSKPKGCQHAPFPGGDLRVVHAPLVHAPSASKPPELLINPGSVNTVVDQLVGLVKRLGPRGSGN